MGTTRRMIPAAWNVRESARGILSASRRGCHSSNGRRFMNLFDSGSGRTYQNSSIRTIGLFGTGCPRQSSRTMSVMSSSTTWPAIVTGIRTVTETWTSSMKPSGSATSGG